MWIRIDPMAPEPLYRQIAAAVKAATARGRLTHGERLPSVRELARELAINPNTVAKAYAELEAAGVIVRRQGAGCFVKCDDRGRSLAHRSAELAQRAERLVTEAFHLGMGPSEVRSAIDDALGRIGRPAELEDGRATGRQDVSERDQDMDQDFEHKRAS
jgi:GntR family transcriptional regulator